jgi:hypothetical protein
MSQKMNLSDYLDLHSKFKNKTPLISNQDDKNEWFELRNYYEIIGDYIFLSTIDDYQHLMKKYLEGDVDYTEFTNQFFTLAEIDEKRFESLIENVEELSKIEWENVRELKESRYPYNLVDEIKWAYERFTDTDKLDWEYSRLFELFKLNIADIYSQIK